MINGTWEPGFDKVVECFAGQVDDGQLDEDGGRGGASLCVYHRDRPVVDVWGGVVDENGRPWQESTLCLAYSTTKFVTATALHRCVDLGLLDYEDPVARHWPEFARGGKAAITVRQVLDHEAGLYALRKWIDTAETLADWSATIDAIEGMEPEFPPGAATAYQAVTFGHVVGELVQRVAGETFGQFIRHEIAEPLRLDGLFIGLPEEERSRVAEIVDLPTADDAEVVRSGALAGRLGPNNPDGGGGGNGGDEGADSPARLIAPRGFDVFIRTPAALDAPIPAANGTFTARSIARLAAALAGGGVIDGVRVLSATTLAHATEIQHDRIDLVVGFPMLWRLGYHVTYTTAGGILPRAFGHTGFGGSGTWADPERELAMCFIPSALGTGLAMDLRFLKLGGRAVRAVDAHDG